MDAFQQEKKFLPIREWAAVLCMLLALAYLTTISFAAKWQASRIAVPIIQVRIVGEVENEMSIQLPFGATIADALAKIVPTQYAALEKLSFDACLKHEQILVIPRKGFLSVFVRGEVEKERVFHFSETATFHDLKKIIVLTDAADLQALKRFRRKLKEGETITIASKKNTISTAYRGPICNKTQAISVVGNDIL